MKTKLKRFSGFSYQTKRVDIEHIPHTCVLLILQSPSLNPLLSQHSVILLFKWQCLCACVNLFSECIVPVSELCKRVARSCWTVLSTICAKLCVCAKGVYPLAIKCSFLLQCLCRLPPVGQAYCILNWDKTLKGETSGVTICYLKLLLVCKYFLFFFLP